MSLAEDIEYWAYSYPDDNDHYDESIFKDYVQGKCYGHVEMVLK